MKDLNNNIGEGKLIDIDSAYELWDWAAEFKVSAEKLKHAVEIVGTSPDAVKVFLKK